MGTTKVEWNLNSAGKLIAKESPSFGVIFEASQLNVSKARPFT